MTELEALAHLPAGAATEAIRTTPVLTSVPAVLDEAVGGVPAREAALALAGEMAAASPVALRQAKRALRAGLETGLAAGLEAEDAAWRAAVASPDRREGIAAFVEKRPPVWGRLS